MEGGQDGASDHLVPCTAADNLTCQIVDTLSTWNKLLLGSKLELREESTASGQLQLARHGHKRFTGASPINECFDTLRLPQYPELIGWLLRTHRCITSVSLKLSSDEITSLSLLDALRHSSGTKTLKLYVDDMKALNAASAIIPSLTKIEELHCTGYITNEARPGGFIAALSALLQASSSLRNLHLTGLHGRVAETLFTGFLLTINTLKELYLEDFMLICDAYPHAISDYLGTTMVLTVLSFKITHEVLQRAILDGVLRNRSIEKLSIGYFIGNEQSVAQVAAVIRENSVIRDLTISLVRNLLNLSHFIYGCWIPPLTQNDTLEEVRFLWNTFSPSEWITLIRALPKKRNLKKVHIDARIGSEQLHLVFTEIKRIGLEENVSITYYCYCHDVEFLRGKAISDVIFCYSETDDRLVAALRVLPSCQHVSQVSIGLMRGNMRVSLALAEYLKSTIALRHLELAVGIVVEGDGASPWWSVIHESLSRNKSLRELKVSVCRYSPQDIEGLADAVKRSQSITWVEFSNMTTKNCTTFVRCLSKGIADNCTLLSVFCGGSIDTDAAGHWFTVCETTRRNAGLVARAARFMQASHLDRYVSGALERVSRYPVLLDEVAEQAHIDKSEIVDLVRDRLKRTETLDGFMRVVGVVRERVICHPPNDDRMQLDDLIEDCWRHVRRYLLIDDVKHNIRHVENI